MIPEYPSIFWMYAILATTLVGISKAGFGGGPALLATPLLSMAIPVIDAAALLLPLLIFCDFFSVIYYRNRFDKQSLKTLLPGAIVGITMGALFFVFCLENGKNLKFGIGVLAIAFVLNQIFSKRLQNPYKYKRPNKVKGAVLGGISGFTSTLVHAGGPPVMLYLLPQNLPRDRFVGTAVIFFTIINLIKLIPYHYLGLLKVGNLTTIAILSPFTLTGVIIGLYLNKRFTDLWFTRIIYTILFITGVQLIVGKYLLNYF